MRRKNYLQALDYLREYVELLYDEYYRMKERDARDAALEHLLKIRAVERFMRENAR